MASVNNAPQSWGRYPKIKPGRVIPVYWRSEIPDLSSLEGPVLPYAYGRSYGDSCLNEGGVSLDVSHLTRFISFDQETGLLRCEAGVSLAQILDLTVPRGWFLPVTPGTKFVSVGGAIANEMHGKNHHVAGTFGCHVTRFELLRSSSERFICSPTENVELFRATIGGLGLTGVILWAEFRLKPITGPYITMERIRYSSLKEFMEISDSSDQDYEYTVAWVDCLASGQQIGRGLFMRGNHETSAAYAGKKAPRKLPLAVPLDFPSVVPFENGYEVMLDILRRISHAGEGSFLAVLKKFGDVPSPGMLSFPRPGLTLALDFSNNGQKTLQLFEELDKVVRESGGSVYPAKDARMSAESFQAYCPQWHEFEPLIDSKFSSSFWRRVTLPVTVAVNG